MNFAIPISVNAVAAGFFIERAETAINLLPPSNALLEFENNYAWSNLQKGFNYAIIDPTILLDKFVLSEDMCQALVERISNDTASVISDGSFNRDSPIGPVGTSTVI